MKVGITRVIGLNENHWNLCKVVGGIERLGITWAIGFRGE